MRFLLFLSVLTMGYIMPAQADEESLVQPGRTVLNISASDRQTAQQDLLIASLRFESESTDSVSLQKKINELMTKGLEISKKSPDVKVSTDNYYVYQYDPNQMIPLEQQPKDPAQRKALIWKGSQGLQLKSKNSEQLLKLMGELQELGFQSSGLNYTLSPEAFEVIRDAMMETALKKLTAKAKDAAKALGKNDAELVEVSVDTAYPYQPPMPMMARAEMGGAMAKDMAAPVASPGESEITLTVSARAILK